MNDLEALYRRVILDHNRAPRNFRRMDEPCSCTDGDNPLCGDRVRVCVKMDNGHIADAAFEARGCAISIASASMMTEAVRGQSKRFAIELATAVREMLGGTRPAIEPAELAALAAVRQFPSRIKCAMLPWQALAAALEGRSAAVTTEDDRPTLNRT